GMVVVGVGKEDRIDAAALAQARVNAALQFRQVEEGLVVRARVAGDGQSGAGDGPGLPLAERVIVPQQLRASPWRLDRVHRACSLIGCFFANGFRDQPALYTQPVSWPGADGTSCSAWRRSLR